MHFDEDGLKKSLLSKERNIHSHNFFILFFTTVLFLFGFCTFFSKNHTDILHTETPVNTEGSISHSFIFFKDGGERQGSWSACNSKGHCGQYGKVYPQVQKPESRWSAPKTSEGGMILLTQTAHKNGLKFKMFKPTNIWRKATEREKGILTVEGVDKHVYSLPRIAVVELVEIPEIRKSQKWKVVLEPLLPEGIIFKPPPPSEKTKIKAQPKPSLPPGAIRVKIKVGWSEWDQIVRKDTTFPQLYQDHFQPSLFDSNKQVFGDMVEIHLRDFYTQDDTTYLWKDLKDHTVLSIMQRPEMIHCLEHDF